FRYGQLVEFPAKTRSPHNYQNPGAFDYVHFLARQSIFWTASTPAGAQPTILPGRCGSWFWQAVYSIRTAALTRIEELYRPSAYNIAMMDAVLIGESSGLERVWTEDFRSTGTFHALVISGSHVAVLAAFFLFLLRICFVPRDWATLATVLAAWLYAFVTGWQAPVVRSAAGMTLFAIGSCFHRRGRMLNILAAVALVFIVADPEQMLDPSFQLSFISVALIAAFVVPLIEKTSGPLGHGLSALADIPRDVHLDPRVAHFRVEMRLAAQTLQLVIPKLTPRASQLLVVAPARIALYFYEVILTSAVIQIGLALPMAMYFHRVSFSGLSANAFVVPLLSAVVPLGFLAIFTNSTVVAQLAAWLLELSRMAVGWHARWEPNWRIPDPPAWLAVAFALALLVAAIRFPWKWVRFATALTALMLLGLLVAHPFRPATAPGTLEITAIDVGQGDSILVAFPDGKLMLIDGGGIPSFGRTTKTRLDIGEDVVAPYLWTRSIRRIDIVALSHAHEDHIGGLAAILQDFDVKELWTGATPSYPSWDRLKQEASGRGVAIKPMRRGEPFRFGGASVQVLAPLPDYEPGNSPKNNDSLVLRLAYGRHSLLLTGDMEKQIEQQLLADDAIRRTDVLKVGHHGSKSSSSPAFLDALHPAFALISDGFENSYGHPHRQTIDNLSQRRIRTLRTDQQGLLTIRSDGRYLSMY
ncbi:MAG: internalization-related competence protein ComEC/Rec2, partial [Bryobacterales bacterium]|nr:internalization-related competence protein ComEC/Rec2 [Bryobacterales bacterium]